VIVVDTTVLVYAAGHDHRLRGPCRRLIELAGAGRIRATTTVEAIQELVHVRARRRDRHDAAMLGQSYAALLAPLLRPDATDLDAGLQIFEHDSRLGAFDAVLAASAIRSGASALASADAGFAGIDGLRHLDPAADQFEQELLALT
jgi:uncharacterized protein